MIFFDIDNTLLDHDYAMRQGARRFLDELGDPFPLSLETFTALWISLADRAYRRYLTGRLTLDAARIWRMQKLFHAAGIDLNADDALGMARKAIAGYTLNWRLFPDVRPCLEQLAARPLGIISNGDLQQQRAKLEALALTPFFATVHISGGTGAAKPEAAIFATACREAGFSANQCAYVGDRLETDALAAAAAGLTGIWLNRKGAAARTADLEKVTEINCLDELCAEA